MHFDIKASSYPQPLNALSRFSTGAHGLHRECLTSRSKCEAKPSQAELQTRKADTDTSFSWGCLKIEKLAYGMKNGLAWNLPLA